MIMGFETINHGNKKNDKNIPFYSMLIVRRKKNDSGKFLK